MSSSRSSKGKSSGLRILWLPGGRKKHSKGRFDATNKHVAYNSSGHKHTNNVWSLGGNKAHKNLLEVNDSETSLFEGPSVSGITPLVSSVAATKIVTACTTPLQENKEILEEKESLTPNKNINTPAILDGNDNNMPAATTQSPQPVIVRTTTTAEILDENRFTLLDKSTNDAFEAFDLRANGTRSESSATDMEMKMLNASSGTNASTASTPTPNASPRKDNISTSSSTTSSNKRRRNAQQSNQGDVNSIESISDSTYPTLAAGSRPVNNEDVGWIDDLLENQSIVPEQPMSQEPQQPTINRGIRYKQKPRERDQMDGVNLRLTNDVENVNNKKQLEEQEPDEDDKVVKCLYYTLMCCDCTIS